jgi:Xaa-Pro aminopeptidase
MKAMAPPSWAGYSVAERDRRWSAVRENAARAGFDCVLVPLCVEGSSQHLSLEQWRGTRSDGRYLTQLDNAAVVLPTDGSGPIVISDQADGNAWVPQVRRVDPAAPGAWGIATTHALLDAGMERARIGVSGLRYGRASHIRTIHGVVNHSSYAEVVRRLPNARFEDGTDLVGLARYLKSDEEVACLRRAATIADAGIDVMVEVARPGVTVSALYARVMQHMLELGSEYYPLALEIGPIGEELTWYENPVADRRLEPGDLIMNETDAVFGGLVAQEGQPIVLGPIPEGWEPVIDLQREAYATGLELMRPGATFGELVARINEVGGRRGMKTAPMLHSRGYGNDGPLISPGDSPADHSEALRFEKGTVWMWKPHAWSADERIFFRWGGCVLVAEGGGEPLVRRPHGLLSVG